jgi:hypothetical protein
LGQDRCHHPWRYLSPIHRHATKNFVA